MGKRALQSFAFSLAAGVNQVVSEEDEYDDDHPFVKANPAMFMDIDDNPRRIRTPVRVEQATAAPGERRAVGRPRKS